MLLLFFFGIHIAKQRTTLGRVALTLYIIVTACFFGYPYFKFHPVVRSIFPYYHYLYVAETTLFRRVPRGMVPELEDIIQMLEPELVKINKLQLYQEFKGNPMQRLHQITANRTDITDEELEYLRRYEMEASTHKKHIQKQSGFIKKPPVAVAWRGKNEEWLQNNGVFVVKNLMWGEKVFIKYRKSHGVLVTGYFYYPPGGFREWHTNENDIIGWRIYYVKREEPNRSWFLWKDPTTGEAHREADCGNCYNMFKLRRRKDGVLWHSVYSDTHRFSIGINIPESLAVRITQRAEEARVPS